MSRPIDVTLSIVNHENRDGVIACLRSVEADPQPRAALEVIVVDNASADGSAATISAAFPSVEVIERTRRAGFGANHNLALRRAAGRYVLLLNDDTQIQAGTIDTLTDYLDTHPRVALAAPRVTDRAGHTQPSAWEQPTPLNDLIAAATLSRRPNPMSSGNSPRRVGWAIGCALLARRDPLLAVGGFDEDYFMYCEEIDLARRLAEVGLETHWVPAAAVVHEGQVSSGGHDSPARAVEMARSRRRFWTRHYSRPGQLVARVSTSLMFLALAAAAVLRRQAWKPFWLQAGESVRDTSVPGLRERAAEWNACAESTRDDRVGGHPQSDVHVSSPPIAP